MWNTNAGATFFLTLFAEWILQYKDDFLKENCKSAFWTVSLELNRNQYTMGLTFTSLYEKKNIMVRAVYFSELKKVHQTW